MKKLVIVMLILLAGSLLGACKIPAPEEAAETEATSPQAVFTASAQTAAARQEEAASLTPSVTATATETQPPAFAFPTATVSITETVQFTAVATGPVQQTGSVSNDRAEFVSDVTVPDGTVFAPGEVFIKTWRLKNIGATTWTTDYKVVFLEGSVMDGPLTVALSQTVAPGESVDISVDMVAPAEPGTYRGYWKMQNAEGQLFGVGIESTEAFWVEIVVQAALASGEGAATQFFEQSLATASMAVDNPEFAGDCPHTYKFTAQFTLTKPATVNYSLEADNDAGVTMKLPPPVTRNLEAGSHRAVFELTFSQDMTGWVRLHFSEPESMDSNRVNFSLACRTES